MIIWLAVKCSLSGFAPPCIRVYCHWASLHTWFCFSCPRLIGEEGNECMTQASSATCSVPRILKHEKEENNLRVPESKFCYKEPSWEEIYKHSCYSGSRIFPGPWLSEGLAFKSSFDTANYPLFYSKIYIFILKMSRQT